MLGLNMALMTATHEFLRSSLEKIKKKYTFTTKQVNSKKLVP